MTALRLLGLYFLGAFVLVAMVAGVRGRLGTKTRTCSHCSDLARQVVNAKEHIRLLERVNAGLAAKVTRLEARRRSERAS